LCNGAEVGVNSGSVVEEKWDLCNGAEVGVNSGSVVEEKWDLCDGAEAGVNSGSVVEEKWDLCNGAEAGAKEVCCMWVSPHIFKKKILISYTVCFIFLYCMVFNIIRSQ
jgi:hypothetical protein